MSYDWHNTQNNEYLTLLLERLEQPKLLWVQQFARIINSYIKENNLSNISIKEIGCNVGHFCRVLEEINTNTTFYGYDTSDTYLAIAKQKFKHLNFVNTNIEDEIPQNTDITIISATFEHIKNHYNALINIFNSTNKLIILRTFIGDSYLEQECKKDNSIHSYIIKQFTIQYLQSFTKNEWILDVVEDDATNSKTKHICFDVYRTQKILIFRKM